MSPTPSAADPDDVDDPSYTLNKGKAINSDELAKSMEGGSDAFAAPQGDVTDLKFKLLSCLLSSPSVLVGFISLLRQTLRKAHLVDTTEA